MAKLLGFLTIVALAGSPPASAQMLDSAARPLDGPRRVSLGVTIPLGGPQLPPPNHKSNCVQPPITGAMKRAECFSARLTDSRGIGSKHASV